MAIGSWLRDIQGYLIVLKENGDPVRRRQSIKFVNATIDDDGFNTVVTCGDGGTPAPPVFIEGLEGAQGPQGEQGYQGERGERGERGFQGEQGFPGEPGADGADGQPGRQGDRGERGFQGEPGDPGQDGQDGFPGQQGLPGRDGRDGADGVDGADGQDGSPGTPGSTGATGATGASGTNGRDGTDGQDGADGIDGQQGLNGKDGAVGPSGFPGLDGQDGSVDESSAMLAAFTLTWADVLRRGFVSGPSDPHVDVSRYLNFGLEGPATGQIRSGDAQFRVNATSVLQLLGGTSALLSGNAGSASYSATTDLVLTTGSAIRLTIAANGEWQVAGTPGSSGQVLTSQGPAASPTWVTPSAGGGGSALMQIVSVDLGPNAASNGEFVISGLSGLTPGDGVLVQQAADDLIGIDALVCSGVVETTSTIRVYWKNSDNGHSVNGVVRFQYAVSGGFGVLGNFDPGEQLGLQIDAAGAGAAVKLTGTEQGENVRFHSEQVQSGTGDIGASYSVPVPINVVTWAGTGAVTVHSFNMPGVGRICLNRVSASQVSVTLPHESTTEATTDRRFSCPGAVDLTVLAGDYFIVWRATLNSTTRNRVLAFSASEGRLLRTSVYRTTGNTHTWLANTRRAVLKVQASGAGGRSATAAVGQVVVGPAGGSGGYAEADYIPTTASVTANAGAGAAADGNGNTSNVTDGSLTLACSGGSAATSVMVTGTAVEVTQGGTGGIGGTTATLGTPRFTSQGCNGDPATRLSASFAWSGKGGDSVFGSAGGANANPGTAGQNSVSPGAGASGGYSNSATSRSGGTTAAGMVVIEEYS